MVEARRKEEVNLRAEEDKIREEEGIPKLAQQVCRELDNTCPIMQQNESDFGVTLYIGVRLSLHACYI